MKLQTSPAAGESVRAPGAPPGVSHAGPVACRAGGKAVGVVVDYTL